MEQYSSFHFSPMNNRSMLMPRLPKGQKPGPRVRTPLDPKDFSDKLNPDNVYFQSNLGLYPKTVDVGGEHRDYAVYVPNGMRSKGAAVLLFGENGHKAAEVAEASHWKLLADKYKVALLVLESDHWRKDCVDAEFDYAWAVVDKEFKQRLTVDICESFIYPIGLGDGAYIATAFALTYSATFPAFAADGDCAVDPNLFDILRALPSDGIDTWKKPEIAMPGFVIDRSGKAEATFAYMKETIRAKEEGLCNKYARVYLEQARRGAYFVNDQPIAQVWLGDGESVKGISQQELHEEMVKFVLRFARWGGFGNNHLRSKKSVEDSGVIRVEREVDGKRRYWDVYVPSCYRPDDGKVYPLVVAIHGFSCNSEYFLQTSDWHRLAEERGFFVVFASGYLIKSDIGRFCLPGWNTGSIGEKGIDELGYFVKLLDYMEETYNIDKSRVYAVGHSNGSRMTQELAHRLPERFAAFGPTGALGGFSAAEVEALPGALERPVWFIMGEYDNSDPEDMSEGSLVRATLEVYCKANGVQPQYDNWYVNGKYRTLVMYDAAHRPMVRYTIMDGCPHTYTGEMAQLTWDCFLCHYSREADGSISYRG